MSDERRDDYLWDGSGEPDELLRSLEDLLRPFRYERPLQLDNADIESESEAQDE